MLRFVRPLHHAMEGSAPLLMRGSSRRFERALVAGPRLSVRRFTVGFARNAGGSGSASSHVPASRRTLAERARLTERSDLVGVETDLTQHREGMLPDLGRRAADMDVYAVDVKRY